MGSLSTVSTWVDKGLLHHSGVVVNVGLAQDVMKKKQRG